MLAAEILRRGLEPLAIAERHLRIGACFDFLSKLKQALGVRSFLTRHARTRSGYNGATINQDSIRRAEANVKRYGRSYRRSWQALNALQISQSSRSGLKELNEGDMTMLGEWLEGEQYRSRGTQLPWIWSIQPPGETPRSKDDVEAAVDKWNKEGE